MREGLKRSVMRRHESDFPFRWQCVVFGLTIAWILGLAEQAGFAQSSGAPPDPEKGVAFYTSFQGSSNTLGQVYRLNTSAGYNFNSHWGIDAGLPVYFLQPSGSPSGTLTSSGTGVGNVYADLNLTLRNPLINYVSTLTGTAPTGNRDRGLSTGRATYDWNNHFDRSFLAFTPFANVGIANSVSDTPLFTRPFTSLGTVGHFEGGTTYRLFPHVRIGASAYDIAPTGQQKIFSRQIPRRGAALAGLPPQSRRGAGAFENQFETVGGSELARDHGYSGWLSAGLGPLANLMVGYTRSVNYDLNAFSFGIGFDIGYLARKAEGH